MWCVQVPGAAGRADLQEHLDLLRGLLHVSPARLFANTCLTSSPTTNPPTQEGHAAGPAAGDRGPARGPALPALRAGPAAEVRLLPQLAGARAVEAGPGLAEGGQRRTERSVLVQLHRCVGTGRWRFPVCLFWGTCCAVRGVEDCVDRTRELHSLPLPPTCGFVYYKLRAEELPPPIETSSRNLAEHSQQVLAL
jgi:hypothetical protein